MVLSQPGEHFTAGQLRALQAALEAAQKLEDLGDLLQAMAEHAPAIDAFVRCAASCLCASHVAASIRGLCRIWQQRAWYGHCAVADKAMPCAADCC